MESERAETMTTEQAEVVLRERKMLVGAETEDVLAEIARRGFRAELAGEGGAWCVIRVWPPEQYRGWPIFADAGVTIVLGPGVFAGAGVDGSISMEQQDRGALIRAFAEAVLNVDEEVAIREAAKGPL